MKYNEDEFFRLMEAVEADGGKHIDEPHTDAVHEMTGNLLKKQSVHYCGSPVQFEVPYRFGTGSSEVLALGTFCAIDDCMGRWPRYASADAEGIID